MTRKPYRRINEDDEYKPTRLQLIWSSIRHRFLWKFSKQYRMSCQLMYGLNPKEDNLMGIVRISTYGRPSDE